MTGLSEDEVLKFGNAYTKKLVKPKKTKYIPTKVKRLVKKMLNIKKNNQRVRGRKRNDTAKKGDRIIRTKKILKKYNMRVSNLVDDMQWKSIKYLIRRYKNILIGDMSTIGIVSGKSKLNQLNKLYAYKLKFYQYRQRLEYKCYITRTGYAKVNERFTSKVCSWCGECKENLGGSKIYNCDKCDKVIDRDVNGCRGIFLKTKMK